MSRTSEKYYGKAKCVLQYIVSILKCYFVMDAIVIYSDYGCNIIFENYGHLTPIQGVQKWKIC